MLAMADKHGEVQGSVPGLARIAGITVPACEKALKLFLSPDKDSRTKTLDGRRIQEIDGGWSLINHEKYRLMASREDGKAKAVQRVQRWRERQKSLRDVNGRLTQDVHIAEADSDSEEEKKESDSPPPAAGPPSHSAGTKGTRLPEGWGLTDELREFAIKHGLDPDTVAANFTDYWRSAPGAKGVKLDWAATFRVWCRRETERPGGPVRRQVNGAGGRRSRGPTALESALEGLARVGSRGPDKPR